MLFYAVRFTWGLRVMEELNSSVNELNLVWNNWSLKSWLLSAFMFTRKTILTKRNNRLFARTIRVTTVWFENTAKLMFVKTNPISDCLVPREPTSYLLWESSNNELCKFLWAYFYLYGLTILFAHRVGFTLDVERIKFWKHIFNNDSNLYGENVINFIIIYCF